MKTGLGGGKQARPIRFDENQEAWIANSVKEDHSLTLDSNSPSVSSTTQPQNHDPTAAGTEVSGRDFVRRVLENDRNPNWALRNRRAHVVKSQLEKKSELGSLNSQVGSLSVDERVDEEQEVQEENGEQEKQQEKGKGKNENLVPKNEVRGERIEVFESIKDEDDIVGRLEQLLLGAEEPELSEEQLRLNDQAQEDEVIQLT